MRTTPLHALCLTLLIIIAPAFADAADHPPVTEGDFSVHDFHFRSGETLPELRIHYRTLGTLKRDDKGIVRNAVLIMHGTTGSGGQFLGPTFAGELFNASQLLDSNQYFIILPDDIGHGKSSRPSDSLHGKFPHYNYGDMIEAEHALVTEGLHINHLRLVMGTSMGGMHTWLWGEVYPDFMDALMPLASLPVQISGRNRMWRKMICDSIRDDPEWQDGEYRHQPPNLRIAAEILYFMGSNPRLQYEHAPTGAKADEVLARSADNAMKTMDANDVLYAVDSSRDYDPASTLEKITAPLLAVNSADDLINPPDLGILEREIKRVPHGATITIPEGPETQGHGTHTLAKLWKSDLANLLQRTNGNGGQ